MDETGDQGLLGSNPVVRALLAPATDDELAGAPQIVEAYREQVATWPRRRRHGLRLSTGAGVVVIGVALSGGVAAAYTGLLPSPVQQAIHNALGPIAPPAPHPNKRVERPAATPTSLPGAVRPASTPSPPRSEGVRSAPALAPATPGASPGVAAPASPVPSAVASPTPSPTAAPRPVLVASASRRAVPVHQGLSLKGTLTRDGTALDGRNVQAMQMLVGGKSWQQVASGTTADDGSVALRVPALTRNVRLRLVGRGVVSNVLTVTVLPKVTATVTKVDNRYAIVATADGADPGETATLLRLDGTEWVEVARRPFDGNARVRFTVPVPARDRQYRVRLAATRTHGAAVVTRTAPAA
jgi:hypothetical protein